MCIIFHVCVVSGVADPSSGEIFHVLVWSKKYVCDSEINSLPRQVLPLSGPGGVSLVKEPIRGRLNSGNVMR